MKISTMGKWLGNIPSICTSFSVLAPCVETLTIAAERSKTVDDLMHHKLQLEQAIEFIVKSEWLLVCVNFSLQPYNLIFLHT